MSLFYLSLLIKIIIIFVLIFIIFYFGSGLLKGAPYAVSSANKLKDILFLANKHIENKEKITAVDS